LAEAEIVVTRLYRLSKRSDGLALWIPSRVAKSLGLREGERMVLVIREGRGFSVMRMGEVVENVGR